MKKLFFTLCFCFYAFVGFSQNFKLLLVVEDNIGRKDTLIFGVNDTATYDLDPSFNEINIYGQAFDSLDVRSRLRDSAHTGCLRNWSGQPITHSQNVDLKSDFRPFDLTSDYSFYEIQINAFEYPISVIADFSEIENSWLEGWSGISLLKSNCARQETKQLRGNIDTLFILNNDSFTTIVAYFSHEVGIMEFKGSEPDWGLYPNPAKQNLAITGLDKPEGTLEIIDIHGKKIQELQLSGKENPSLNIAGLTNGIYLIRYVDFNKKTASTRKFIKE